MIQIPSPALPRNFLTQDRDQSKFNGSLTVALTNYLTNLATRANGALPKDGSEAFTGSLAISGDIAAGNATFATVTSVGPVNFNDQIATNSGNLLAGRVKVTTFTSNGTFTTDADCLFADMIAYGGGGGGGGCIATGVGQASAGAGGSGGAKAQVRVTAATLGASQSVTIGAGGTGVNGAAGNAGAATTVGSLVSAKGGEGGTVSGAGAAFNVTPAAATQSATGDLRGWTFPAPFGGSGTNAYTAFQTSGSNELGGGIIAVAGANGTNANANTGAGGGGTVNPASNAARTGGTGGSGFVIIYEYLRAA